MLVKLKAAPGQRQEMDSIAETFRCTFAGPGC
ncbi:hypothetical protein [Paenibacillus sp. JJ-223]